MEKESTGGEIDCVEGWVSEPACFGAAPAIFYPEPAPGNREHNVGIF